MRWSHLTQPCRQSPREVSVFNYGYPPEPIAIIRIIGESLEDVPGKAGDVAAPIGMTDVPARVVLSELPGLLQECGQLDRMQAKQQLGTVGNA